jgi:hypothetical protein
LAKEAALAVSAWMSCLTAPLARLLTCPFSFERNASRFLALKRSKRTVARMLRTDANCAARKRDSNPGRARRTTKIVVRFNAAKTTREADLPLSRRAVLKMRPARLTTLVATIIHVNVAHPTKL